MNFPILFLILTFQCQWTDASKDFKFHNVDIERLKEPEVLVEGTNVEFVIMDKILKEDEASLKDSKSFAKMVNHHLDGLMVRFRSRVFNLYRKITCGEGLCDPWNPELELSQTDLLHKPTALKIEITNITTWHECPAPPSPSSYIVFRKSLRSFYIVGSLKSAELSVYELEGNGQCKFLNKYTSPATGPCFTAFNADEFPLLLVGPCNNDTKVLKQVNVYLITDDNLKLVQEIETRNLQQMFTLIHHKDAYLFVISLDEKSNQYCKLYKWLHTEFVYQVDFKCFVGQSMRTFSYGHESYLVSTNYKSAVTSPVTIWQFGRNKKTTELKLYQVLNDCHVRDVEEFTVGNLQFLAVSCLHSAKNESHLYWWTGSQFLLWQSMPAPYIRSWIALKLNNDDTALVMHSITNNHHILQVYQLDEGYYWPNKARLLIDRSSRNTSEISITGFQHVGMNLLTSVENDKFLTFRFKMNVSPPKMFSSDDVEDEEELNCLKEVGELVAEEEIRLQRLENAFIQIQQLKLNQSTIDTPKSHAHEKSDSKHCRDIHEKISELEFRVGKADAILQERMQNENKVNYDSITVNRLTVLGSVTTQNMLVNSDVINGVYLTDLHRAVVSKTRNQIFNASVSFQGGLDVDFLEVESTLNGQRIADNMAIRGAKNVFTQPLQFQSLTVDTAQINKVNNISLSDLVLKSTSQTIHGKKTIKKLVARQNIILNGGEINGVNLVKFNVARMTLTSNQTITGNITFLNDVTIHEDLDCENINNVNITELSTNVVTTNTRQEIMGRQEFVTNVYIDEASFAGKLNNINMSSDVMTKHSDQIIPYDIVIKGNVHVKGDLDVEETVNDMDISRDLITRCGDHVIHGKKEFKDDVYVEDLSKVKASNTWQHFGDVTVSSLDAVEVNGKNLGNFLNQMARKSVPQTFYGALKSPKILFKNVWAEQVTGEKLEDLYITTKTDQIISTPIIFNSDVLVNGSVRMLNNALLNGLRVSELPKKCVMKTGDQIIKSHKKFQDVVSENGIRVMDSKNRSMGIANHLLNSVDYDLDVLTVDADAEISQLTCKFLNGVFLDSFLSRMYTTDKSFSITSGKQFENLIVKGNLYLATRLNGVNVTHFFKNVIRLSTHQVIHGDVKFLHPVSCNGPIYAETINDRNFASHVENMIRSDRTNSIPGGIKFPNGLRIDGDVNLQLINGVNFTEFLKKVLLNSAYQVFQGPSFFSGNVITGDILVLGELNGVKTSDYILLNQNTTLNGSVHFKKPVIFEGLRVNDKLSLPVSSENMLHFREFRAKSIDLKGTLNDIKVEDLPALVLSKTRNQIISASHVIFENDISIVDLHLRQTIINGIDLNVIRHKAVTTDLRQIITGRKTWVHSSHVILKEPVLVKGNVFTEKFISPMMNYTEISKEDREAFLKGGTLNGDVIFLDKVDVKGKVNDLNFPKDVFLLKKDQTLPPLQFEDDLEVNSLAVTGNVNFINLRELIHYRVTLSTEQTLYGDVKFHDVVEVNEPVRCKHFNELKSQEMMPDFIKEFQEDVWEDIVFDRPVIIEGSVGSKYTFNSLPVQGRVSKKKVYSENGTTPCLRSLLETSQALSGIINNFEIAIELLSSHSVGHVIHNGSVYLLLAVSGISQTTCHNIKVIRCDAEIFKCHPSRGIFKLPKGYVRNIYTFESNNITSQAFVMEAKMDPDLNPSSCPKLFDGVFVFVDILQKSRAYFLVPVSKVTDVTIFPRENSLLHVLISSLDYGVQIYALEKNVKPKVVDFQEFTSLDATTVKYFEDPYIFTLVKAENDVELVSYIWKKTSNSKLIHEFNFQVPKNTTGIAAFNIGDGIYFALGGESINVYSIQNTSCTEIQEISQRTKTLESIEYYGKVYLMALTENDELNLYKWTDLFKFTLVTRVKSPYAINHASVTVILGNVYLFSLPDLTNRTTKLAPTTIYKGIHLGRGQPQECWL